MHLSKLWLLSVPLVVGAISGKSPTRQVEPSCVIAARWVKEHKNDLPSHLAEFSRFSIGYRKTIYAELPDSIQRRLWHEQLVFYGGMPAYSAAQREFILRADANLASLMDTTARGRGLRSELGVRGKAILGDTVYARIFANLGLDPTVVTGDSTVRSNGEPEPPLPCHCWIANEVNDCAPGQMCHMPAGSCAGAHSCGPFWCEWCDGRCFG